MLTEIFCVCDDFCNFFSHFLEQHQLPEAHLIQLNTSPRMTTSEIMTILIAFHLSGYHDLKHFYLHAQRHFKAEFPGILSYSRFVELMPQALMCLLLMAVALKGESTGKSFIDSTAIAVCKNKRIFSHRVFKHLAKRGKTSMGWFFGFKLHLVTNHLGHILSFKITPGNVDDRAVVPDLVKDLVGKLFADKGYISQNLFEKMLEKSLKIVTSIRSNMKPQIIEIEESETLGTRSLIESVFNVLKNSCRIEHSRHRSPVNFCVNIVAALCAYIMRVTLFKAASNMALLGI